MKNLKRNVLKSLIGLCFVAMAYVAATAHKSLSALQNLQKQQPEFVADQQQIKLPTIREFTKLLMEDCKSSSEKSEAGTKITLERIVRASDANLEGLEKYAWVGLLCMETRVGKLNKAKSSAGALGIGQIMPETARIEAKRCGYGDIKIPDDLHDEELNLLISSCHFKELVRVHGIELAPLAYNAGGGSESVKRAKALVPPTNLETAGYAAIQGVILTRYLLEPLTTQMAPPKPKKIEEAKVAVVKTSEIVLPK